MQLQQPFGTVSLSQAPGRYALTIGLLAGSKMTVYGTLDELQEVVTSLQADLDVHRDNQREAQDDRAGS